LGLTEGAKRECSAKSPVKGERFKKLCGLQMHFRFLSLKKVDLYSRFAFRFITVNPPL
jgi:hypothetical protein